MTLTRLVFRNILGNAFRSLVILLCAALIAGLALAALFVVRGGEAGLRLNLRRLGADLLVLPWGTIVDKIGGVRLMTADIEGWMPTAYMDKITALEGVDAVSPQLHLATLPESPYCDEPEMYLVAYDPSSDFTLRPWYEGEQILRVAIGEAIIGARVTMPDNGDSLRLGGQPLRVVGQLEPTADSIDATVFVNFETAEEMIAWSKQQSQPTLSAVSGSISAMMVKVTLDSDAHEVAVRILEQAPGVIPLETPNLFRTERRQMIGVLRTMLSLLSVIWVLTLVFLGLVFTIAINERRWEIGVLRAIGLPSTLVLKALLAEGIALALVGGFLGVIGAIAGFTALGEHIVRLTGVPLLVPSAQRLLPVALGGLVAAIFSITLAAFVPVWRISREEVALAMRE